MKNSKNSKRKHQEVIQIYNNIIINNNLNIYPNSFPNVIAIHKHPSKEFQK